MQKTAQKRTLRDKYLKELAPSAISGRAAENFFNPEFKEVMENLRVADNKIRAIASGQDIEGQDPGSDPIALKELLKNAKSNLNRREYMTVVADLGRFHNKMSEISTAIKALNTNVDKVHHQFLFKELGDEQKKQLLNLHQKFASQYQAEMVKQSSIADFFINIGTKRGRALAAWEKRYPKQVNKLKKETINLLSSSEKLFTTLISSLKEMASSRAKRNVDNYVKSAQKINSVYEAYNTGFKTYYQENVKGFLMQTDFLPKEETAPAVKVENGKELGQQEVGKTPTVNAPPSQDVINTTAPTTIPPSASPSTIPSPPPEGMDSEPPLKSDQVYREIQESGTIPGLQPQRLPIINPPPPGSPPQMPPTSAHRKFYDTLEALSGEDPLMLASFIRKYAVKIQDSDPETSINLFKIARSIRA
jgi:hypothetical protein